MTETEICNAALGRLGEAPILSLTDTGATARACALHFKMTRDAVLRSHRWNFACKRGALAEMGTAPLFGWDHAYQLPADFLRVVEVNESEDGAGNPWAVEQDQLLTNDDAVNLVYVYRLEDASKFDPLFNEALACKLAEKLASTLRGSSSGTVDFAAEYERIVAPLARRVDANESRGRKGMKPYRSMFVAARGATVE